MVTFQLGFDPNAPVDPAAVSEVCVVLDASGVEVGRVEVDNFPATTFAFDIPDDIAATVASCYLIDSDAAGNAFTQGSVTPLSVVPPPDQHFSRSAISFTRVDAPPVPGPSGFRVTKR